MRLVGEDDRSIIGFEDQRLVARDVSRRADNVHARPYLRPTVEQLVAGPGYSIRCRSV